MVTIISCVGMRPLAVISPISTLIERKKMEKEDLQVVLFTTEFVREKAEKSKSYLEERFPGISVRVVPLEKDNIRSVLEPENEEQHHFYFNVDPGMNWSVAMVSYYLPSSTTCFYADFARLYLWNINEDPQNAYALHLLNVGLDTYNRFSDDLLFEEEEGINEGLRENIKSLLKDQGFKSHVRVKFRSPEVPELLRNFVNSRLVRAFEKHASICLLFDFQFSHELAQMSKEEAREKRKEYTALYRAVTEIFNPLNFSVSFATDDYHLRERALADGYPVIWTREASGETWKERLINWITGNYRVRPKSVIHRELKRDSGVTVSKRAPARKNLFVCLGDNVTPTLKAILSHDPENVYLFYDRNSDLISSIARNLRDLMMTRGKYVELIETNNRGQGIIEFIMTKASRMQEFQINLTPGTKAQTVALTRAAKLLGNERNLFTIHSRKGSESITRLVDDESLCEVINPSPEMIIKCQPVKFKEAYEPPEIDAFLKVMAMLAQKRVSGNLSHILGLRLRNKPVFKKLGTSSQKNKIRLWCLLDGKDYEIEQSFIDSERSGIWWEAAVAYVIKKGLDVNVMWSAMWEWPGSSKQKRFLTELDVVFGWNNYICVVSCKTGREGFSPVTRYEVKSEARKRFDRFALPFIAVPVDEYHGKLYAGVTEEGVMYLTPSVLAHGERLKEVLGHFAISKKTTQAQNFLAS